MSGAPTRSRLLALAAAVGLVGCSLAGAPSTAPRPASGSAGPRSEAAGAARPRAALATPPARPFEEVRGLWVVRTTLARRQTVSEMVQRAEEAGFNTLIVQVRGRGDAFYASRWEPRAESLEGQPGGFDPLQLVLDEAHRRGMAVHAWLNTHLVWGAGAPPAAPDHIVRAHPDWLAVPRALGRDLYDMDPADPSFVGALSAYAQANADRVEGLYTSPSHPAVQERIYAVWMDLVERYDLDGLHFDYVRYPSGAFDYSRGALERFRDWVEPRLSPDRRGALAQASGADPYAFVEALPGPWAEFRRAQITNLVEGIYHGVKARRPEVVVSAAVFANLRDATTNRYQEWAAWLERGLVDVVVPMAYTADDGRFEELVATARDAAGAREGVWAGIGAYVNSLDGTVEKITRARSLDTGGFVLFSYDWIARQDAGGEAASYLQRITRAAGSRR